MSNSSNNKINGKVILSNLVDGVERFLTVWLAGLLAIGNFIKF